MPEDIPKDWKLINIRGGGLCVESGDRRMQLDLLDSFRGVEFDDMVKVGHLITAAPELLAGLKRCKEIAGEPCKICTKGRLQCLECPNAVIQSLTHLLITKAENK